jgi:hypothetical protein
MAVRLSLPRQMVGWVTLSLLYGLEFVVLSSDCPSPRTAELEKGSLLIGRAMIWSVW